MIRPAYTHDVARIMEIVRSAQIALAELAIDQWQDGYPSRDVIEQDIIDGVGYVAVDDNDYPIGYAAIVLTGEIAYKQIPDNEWNTPDEYVVVHRLCVDGNCRRGGIATTIMRYAADVARQKGYRGFRIDTHRGNIRMMTMMQRLGFVRTGNIHYDSGERIAFDLDLNFSKTL